VGYAFQVELTRRTDLNFQLHRSGALFFGLAITLPQVGLGRARIKRAGAGAFLFGLVLFQAWVYLSKIGLGHRAMLD
jgi:hypothetical protein